MLFLLIDSNQNVQSACYVPGTALGTGHRAAKRPDKTPALVDITAFY